MGVVCNKLRTFEKHWIYRVGTCVCETNCKVKVKESPFCKLAMGDVSVKILV